MISICKLNCAEKMIINFATKFDGAKRINNGHNVVAGFKVLDISTINLIQGRLIKLQPTIFFYHSCIAMGKQTKAICVEHNNPAQN